MARHFNLPNHSKTNQSPAKERIESTIQVCWAISCSYIGPKSQENRLVDWKILLQCKLQIIIFENLSRQKPVRVFSWKLWLCNLGCQETVDACFLPTFAKRFPLNLLGKCWENAGKMLGRRRPAPAQRGIMEFFDVEKRQVSNYNVCFLIHLIVALVAVCILGSL